MARKETPVSGMGRLDMMTKSFLRTAALVVVGLGVLGVASLAYDTVNLPTQGDGSTKKNCGKCPVGTKDCSPHRTGDQCCPCEEKDVHPDCKVKEPCDQGATASPDSLPSLGEAVALHMMVGGMPLSSEWSGTPNFGAGGYLNWMSMVTIPAG